MSHLLSGGYGRVACITGPLTTTTGYQRHFGYRKALNKAGVAPNDSLVRVADFASSEVSWPCKSCWTRTHPDVVFVTNHLMAIGFPGHRRRQARHPPDMAVVSFDDMPWSSLLQPPLTAVAQPAYDLGVENARLLLSRLEGYTGAARMVTLPPRCGSEGVHRPSLALPPGAAEKALWLPGLL